jgi:OmpA-OmpF porin, OOP family
LKSTSGFLTLAAAILLALPIIAKAQATEGAFVNGSLGSASLDSRFIDDNDTSYGVNAGYRWAVSPETLIGFEAGYVDLGRYSALTTVSMTSISVFGGPPAVTVTYPARVTNKLSGWTLGANARFSLSPNWYVSGRAGFLRASDDSRLRYTGTDDSVVVRQINVNVDGWYAGAGFGYDFSKNLSFGLNYDYYNARKHFLEIDADLVSVTGEYRF